MSYTILRQTLAEALDTAYKIPEDDIATLIPENEEEFNEAEFKSRFLELDRERISSINQKGKDKFEQGYSKAKKEVLQGFESEIKEQFNIEDADLMGIDLVKKVAETSAKTTKGDPKSLTEDELKSHPAVITMLNEKDKEFKQQTQTIEEEYNSKLANMQKEQTFNLVSKRALEKLEEMNPVLSEDPTKSRNQKNILINELRKFDYQVSGDEIIPLEDGKRLESGHGHGITFDQLVKERADQYFDFKQADPRQAPRKGDEGRGGKYKIPTSEAEYSKVMDDTSIPLEDRQKIKEEYYKNATS